MLVGKKKSRIKNQELRIKVILTCFLFIVGFVAAIPVFAQIPDFGVSNLNGLTPLKGGDLRDIIFKIIQYLMGFLALIVFLLILYAGVMWMTSGGDPGKIKKAKGIIANAVIGLAIIIFSYTITLFVFKIIKDIAGTGGGGTPGGTCTPAQCQGCFRCNAAGTGSSWDQSCSASCTGLPGGGFVLKSVETANGGNTQNDVYACSNLEGIFNNYVNKNTLSSDTKIVDMSSNTDVAGNWSVSGNTIGFVHPAGAKFTKGTASAPHPYQARFSKSLTDTSGLFLTACALSANCSIESSYLAWNFGVGPNDDTSKPTITSSYPESQTTNPTYPDRDVSPAASVEVTFSESVATSSLLDPPTLDPGSPGCQVTPKPSGCYSHPKAGAIVIEEMTPPTLDPGSPGCQVTPKPLGCMPSGGTPIDASSFAIDSKGNGFNLGFIRPSTFKPFTWYRITVANIKDLCGNQMDTPRVWVWQTNGSVPSVSGYPTTGKVCTDSKVLFTFGTPMAGSRVSLSVLGADSSSFQIALGAPSGTGITSVSNADGILRILDAKSPIDNGYRQYEFTPARAFGENVTYTVTVTTDYVVSADGSTLGKTWTFTTANASTCQCAPFIQSINPSHGPAGMCVTISGYCFAGTAASPATPSQLVFDATPATIEGSGSSYITTVVPPSLALGTRAKPNFTITFPDSTTVSSNNQTVEYSVDQATASQGPCLLSLSPTRGGIDTSVIARGKSFGVFDAAQSSVLFTPSVSAPVSASTWSDTQAQTRVPSGAGRGNVVVKNQAGTSNGIEFIVLAGVGQGCSQTPGTCSPDPSVCDASQNLICSPTCTCVRSTGGGNGSLTVVSKSPTCQAACTNSVVTARVSKPLLASSVSNASMSLAPCLTNACDTFGSPVPLTVQYVEDLSQGIYELVGTPNTSLSVGTLFRVTVAATIQGTNSETMSAPYSWVFTTKSSQCVLDSVEIRPQQATAQRVGVTQSWTTLATGTNQQCTDGINYINPATLPWVWTNSDDTVAPLTPNGSKASSQSKTVGSTIVRADSGGVFAEALFDVLPVTCSNDAQCQNPGSGISCAGSSCDPATKRCLPSVNSFSPATAAIGDFVTVNGCYFGTTPGTVTFTNQIPAVVPDASICGATWTDRQVVVEVPLLDSPTNDPTNDATNGPITVTTSSGLSGVSGNSFSVGTQSVPGICRITPSFGRWQSSIRISGKGFGATIDNPDGDRVIFSQMIPADPLGMVWSAEHIDTRVQQNAVTGPVHVRNNNIPSNGYQFTVISGGVGSGCGTMNQTTGICTPNKSCAPGLWCETTGANACTCQQAPSVSILGVTPQGNNQCRNVQASVLFNQLMDTASLTKDTVQLWQGTPSPNARPDLVPQSISANSACSGKPVVLTGSVQNVGAADASAYEARLWLGTYSCMVSTVTTKAGATSPVTCSVTPATSGSFIVSIDADPNKRLVESDETNNNRSGAAVGVTGAPTAPTGFAARNVADTSLDLSWNDSPSETGYSIYRGVTSSFSTATKIRDLPANTTAYNETGLSCGQNYYYWIESVNGCGSVRVQSPVTAQTLSCSDIALSFDKTTLSLSAGSSGSVAITVDSVNNKSSSVALSFSGCPTGATCQLTPSGSCSVAPAASCQKTLSVNLGSTTPGTYVMTMTAASSGGSSEQGTITVVVGAPPDTTPPVCGTVSYSPPLSNWTRGPVTVNVGCSDTGTGCSSSTSSTQVSSNGSGTIPITDNATPPNTTQCSYTVTNIDTINPIVAASTATPPGFSMESTAMGGSITISSTYPTARWNTSDAGSGIARVELWRADYTSVCNETNKAGCLWTSRWSDANAQSQTTYPNGRDDVDPIQSLGGNYWYGIHVVDRAGNCVLENNQPCAGGVGDPVHVIMNVLLPDFTLTSVPTTRSMKQNSTISYSITAASLGGFSSSVAFSVTGTGPGTTATFAQTSCSPTCVVSLDVTTSQTAQLGTYTLLVQGTSGSLVHSIPVTLTVSLNDITAPTVGILGVPTAWQKGNAPLTTTCSDSGDGCDSNSLQINLASNNATACSVIPLSSYQSSPQAATSHVWACATATDLAGNRGFSSMLEIKVDNEAPAGASLSGTPGTCGTISWSITGATDTGGSGLAPSAYSFDNGTSWQPTGQYIESIPSGGPSTRTARVRDAAGNVWVSTPVTVTAVECDTTPPTIAFDIQSRPWGNTDVLVTITATDLSGVATTRHCITASASCDPLTTPDTSTFTSGTPIVETRNGSWTMCARAKDAKGNWSPSPVCSGGLYQIDKIAPSIALFTVEGVAYGTTHASNSDGTVDVAWNVSDTGGSGLGQVEIWRAPDNAGVPGNWGTAPVFTSTSASGSWPDTRTNGTYWYGIHAVDKVAPSANCMAGDTSGTSKGHCGGVTSDSEDVNRQRRDPIAVDVAIPVPSFTISLSPANVTVAQGINAQYSVSVNPVNGFSTDVTSWSVKAGTCPGNASNCSLGFATCSSASYANCGTLTVATGSLTPSTYPGIAVVGSSGTVVKESNAVTLSMSDPWWNLSWSRRQKISFTNSTGSALSDVPVLVTLTSPAKIDYSITNNAAPNAGYDIRFIGSDGSTQFSFEVERWGGTTNAPSYVWVKIPSVAIGANTFWLYYGNSAAVVPPVSDRQAVWSNGYAGVWHLSEQSGLHRDSTGNNNNSAAIDVAAQGASIGIADGADQFNSASVDNIDIGDSASLKLGAAESMTAEVWLQSPSSGPANYQFLINKKIDNSNSDGWQLHLDPSGLPQLWMADGIHTASSEWVRANGTTPLKDNSWHYVVGRWNDSSGVATLFVDGLVSATDSSSVIDSITNAAPLVLGEEGDVGDVIPRGYNFEGSLDEVRFSKVVRSNAWIAFQNVSIRDVTLLTFGGEQTQISYIPPSVPLSHRLASRFQSIGVGDFVEDVVGVIAKLFIRNASAQPTTGTLIPTSLSFGTIPSGTSGCAHAAGCTVAYLRPSQALGANIAYSLYTVAGVKSKYGVVLANDDVRLNQFTTGAEICSVTSVGIDPSSVSLTQKGEEQTVRSVVRSGSSEIAGIPGVYDWSYGWSNNASQSFSVSPNSPASTAVIRALRNGNGSLTSTVTITSDTARTPSTKGTSFSGSGAVSVFLCDTPWVYDDASQHMVMKYCLDGSTQLPAFSNPPSQNTSFPTLPGGDKNLFDGLFLRGGGSPDAIGLRIYTNLDHLDMRAWYNKNITNRGNPSSIKVDGFEALRDGRTVYVSAINTQGVGFGQKTYTNIYVLSYNQGADTITKTVYDQLVSGWQFMTNVPDQLMKDRFKRDAVRLTTIGTIIKAVESNGTCPSLTGGSYIPGRSTSAWSSWQSQLVSELKVSSLATDPLNTFVNCPVGYNPTTCWNASTGDFQCPSGSHVMQYYREGNDCRVSVNMELKSIQWEGNPPLSSVTSGLDTCDSTKSWQLLSHNP